MIPSPPDPARVPARRVRVIGIVVMGLGLTLVGIIGAVAWFTLPLILGWDNAQPGSSYSGSRLDTIFILAIYALVAAVGFSAMLAGFAYFHTGRARMAYRRPMLFFVSMLLLVAIVGKAFIGAG